MKGSRLNRRVRIVMGNPGVSRSQPVPIPQGTLPATHMGLPIKISPKIPKTVEK